MAVTVFLEQDRTGWILRLRLGDGVATLEIPGTLEELDALSAMIQEEVESARIDLEHERQHEDDDDASDD